MTRFERDAREVEAGNATIVLKERQAELKEIIKKGMAEKNGFRRTCLAQEYAKRKYEYEQLDKFFEGTVSLEDLI